MKIPVVPFLAAVIAVEAAFFLSFAAPGTWPLTLLATANFLYSANREFWHNGRPLVLRRRK